MTATAGFFLGGRRHVVGWVLGEKAVRLEGETDVGRQADAYFRAFSHFADAEKLAFGTIYKRFPKRNGRT